MPSRPNQAENLSKTPSDSSSQAPPRRIQPHSDSQHPDLLAARARFDREYYLSCYRDEIPPGTNAFEHFLHSGLDRGLKPNATFDPLIRRLQTPGLDRAGTLRQLAETRGGQQPDPTVSSVLPTIRSLPDLRPPFRVPEDDAANVAAARDYGLARTIPLTAGGRRYRLTVPPARAFMDRLRDDRPFAFTRLSHGDWDCLHAYHHYRKAVRAAAAGSALGEEHLDRLALRHCDQVLGIHDMFVENFLFELMHDLHNRCRDQDLMYGISFKGYPTADERLFEWSFDDELHPTDIERLRLFSEFFDPSETLYDATLWKRWLISGGMQELPALARERPVILLGAEHIATLGNRWNTRWFFRVPMPEHQAYTLRHAILHDCREAITEASEVARRHGTKRPLFVTQGSSLAYWFITRLFQADPSVFYLDFGQALHAWFYDIKEIDLVNWGRIYGPTIVRNTGLEDFYRKRGVSDPVVESLFGSAASRGGSPGS